MVKRVRIVTAAEAQREDSAGFMVFVFLVPGIIALGAFFFVPMGFAAYYSFTGLKAAGLHPLFAGLGALAVLWAVMASLNWVARRMSPLMWAIVGAVIGAGGLGILMSEANYRVSMGIKEKSLFDLFVAQDPIWAGFAIVLSAAFWAASLYTAGQVVYEGESWIHRTVEKVWPDK